MKGHVGNGYPLCVQARLALMHSLAWRHQHYLSRGADRVPPMLLSQYFPGGWTETDRGESSLLLWFYSC